MATSGKAAWDKHFAGKDVETTIKENAQVYDATGKKVLATLPKNSSIFIPKTSTWSPLISIVYDNKKNGLIPFAKINKPVSKKSSAQVKAAGLKPSDVTPTIVDVWLEPEEIIQNTKKYVNSISIGDIEKETLNNLLDKTIQTQNQQIDITGLDPEIVPSEFFEILTSVKLVMLLRNNDMKIKKILGVKGMNLSKSKMKIMIPQQANMPLLDYYVSISASNNPNDAAMRISVKSKVKGKSTNTIKFKDAFDSQQEIDNWYKSIITSERSKQIGQKIVAESAVNAPKGKALLYPTIAVSELLSKRSDLIKAAIGKFKKPDKFNQATFEAAIKKLARSINSSDKKDQLDTVLDGEQLTQFTRFMMMNLRDANDNPVANISIGNASFMCEKILVRAAQEDMKSVRGGLNFYRMFYSQILENRQIAYAIARKVGSKKNLQLKYDYYSLVNWEQEYGDWVTLRSKNLINNLNDTLGMDPVER